jgi:hypothetical protein
MSITSKPELSAEEQRYLDDNNIMALAMNCMNMYTGMITKNAELVKQGVFATQKIVTTDPEFLKRFNARRAEALKDLTAKIEKAQKAKPPGDQI